MCFPGSQCVSLGDYTLHRAWNAKWRWSLLFHPRCSSSGSVPLTSLMQVLSGILLGTERGAPGQKEWKESVAALTFPEGRARLSLVVPSHFSSRGQQKKRYREGKKCIIHWFFKFSFSFSAVYHLSHDAALILMHVCETTVKFSHLGSP